MSSKHSSLILIQCDWDDILWKLEGEVWISYKVKDEKSVYGKLRCTQIQPNGFPKLSATNGFSVQNIAKDHLQLSYKDAVITTVFVAASKVYSGIHKKGIISLSVSAKGLSVSVCKENQLLVWDFNQGDLKWTLAGHVGDVYKCKFFPSGEVVLSGGADMQLKIWCALSGKNPVTLTGHTMAVTDFDFIDKGKNIVSVSKDGRCKLWSCAKASCLDDVAQLSSSINCCHVFTAPSSLPIPPPDTTPSEDEVETKDKIVLLGCEDGSVHGFGVCSRQQLFRLSCDSAVNSITHLTDGLFLVGCQNGQVLLYDTRNTDYPVSEWYESNSAVLCLVAYKENGFFTSHQDGQVVYRSVKHAHKRVLLTGPDCDPVYDLSVDNQFVYTCSRDALIRRYNVERTIFSFLNE